MRHALFTLLMGLFFSLAPTLAKAEEAEAFFRLENLLASRQVDAEYHVSASNRAGSVLLAASKDGPAKFSVLQAEGDAPVLQRAIFLMGTPVGAPVIAPSGQRVFSLSQDGWLQAFHLGSGREIAKMRLGFKARGLALSGDGAWLLAGLAEPGTLVPVRVEDFTPYRVIPARDEKNRVSEAAFVLAVPQRSSFVAALPGIGEIWELSHDPNAEPVYSGMVHSFEKGLEEAVGEEQPFARQRTRANVPWDTVFLAPGSFEVLAQSRNKAGGAVYNLDARRLGSTLPADEILALTSAVRLEQAGQIFILAAKADAASVLVLDSRDWTVAKRIALPAPARHMALRPVHGEIWITGFAGKDQDRLMRLNIQTGVLTDARLAAKSVVGPLVFSPDGKTVYISDGDAVAAFDADRLTPKGRAALGGSVDVLSGYFLSAPTKGVRP